MSPPAVLGVMRDSEGWSVALDHAVHLRCETPTFRAMGAALGAGTGFRVLLDRDWLKARSNHEVFKPLPWTKPLA